jgi:hypothetical protein
MYLDRTLVQFRLSLESIRLWERHTREYVEEVKQGTARRTLDAESPAPRGVRGRPWAAAASPSSPSRLRATGASAARRAVEARLL